MNESAATPPAIEVVLITGLSGAGRGTAARILEDLGWYVVDNVPPELISHMVDLSLRNNNGGVQLAVVLDVRSRGFTGDIGWVRDALVQRGIAPRVLFLESSDAVLVRRFEQVRRSHPLQAQNTLSEGIEAERALLAPIKAAADLVLDTSALSVHQLRDTLENAFGAEGISHTSVTVQSFGFKYGLPMDADMVTDVRFLPNPHWIPDLRAKTGQDAPVSDYVLAQEGASEFLGLQRSTVDIVVAGYRREGKRYMTIGIGCTGGKHRSVAISEALAASLREDPLLSVRVLHRDLGRE